MDGKRNNSRCGRRAVLKGLAPQGLASGRRRWFCRRAFGRPAGAVGHPGPGSRACGTTSVVHESELECFVIEDRFVLTLTAQFDHNDFNKSLGLSCLERILDAGPGWSSRRFGQARWPPTGRKRGGLIDPALLSCRLLQYIRRVGRPTPGKRTWSAGTAYRLWEAS